MAPCHLMSQNTLRHTVCPTHSFDLDMKSTHIQFTLSWDVSVTLVALDYIHLDRLQMLVICKCLCCMQTLFLVSAFTTFRGVTVRRVWVVVFHLFCTSDGRCYVICSTLTYTFEFVDRPIFVLTGLHKQGGGEKEKLRY